VHVVKNTPKVTGFRGTGNKPFPDDAEVDRIVNQVTVAAKKRSEAGVPAGEAGAHHRRAVQ